MSEAEKADTRAFLKEILQILPLVGLRAFEFPKAVAVPQQEWTILRGVFMHGMQMGYVSPLVMPSGAR